MTLFGRQPTTRPHTHSFFSEILLLSHQSPPPQRPPNQILFVFNIALLYIDIAENNKFSYSRKLGLLKNIVRSKEEKQVRCPLNSRSNGAFLFSLFLRSLLTRNISQKLHIDNSSQSVPIAIIIAFITLEKVFLGGRGREWKSARRRLNDWREKGRHSSGSLHSRLSTACPLKN